MSLAAYEEARPWAEAIKEEVLTRRMPKWHAARGYGDFSNDPSLSPFEIALIAAWADGGAPRGTEADARTAATSADGEETERLPAGARDVALPCGEQAAPEGTLLAIRPMLDKGGSVGISVRLPDGRREIVGLDPRLRAGVSDHLPVAGAADSAAQGDGQCPVGGGIVQHYAHASGTVTTKAAVTTAPRR